MRKPYVRRVQEALDPATMQEVSYVVANLFRRISLGLRKYITVQEGGNQIEATLVVSGTDLFHALVGYEPWGNLSILWSMLPPKLKAVMRAPASEETSPQKNALMAKRAALFFGATKAGPLKLQAGNYFGIRDNSTFPYGKAAKVIGAPTSLQITSMGAWSLQKPTLVGLWNALIVAPPKVKVVLSFPKKEQ